jgi:hypothetical protein
LKAAGLYLARFGRSSGAVLIILCFVQKEKKIKKEKKR